MWLQKLFHAVSAERNAIDDSISPPRRAVAYVLALEFWLGSMIAQEGPTPIRDLKRVYPFAIVHTADGLTSDPAPLQFQRANIIESVVESTGLVLHHLAPSAEIERRAARQTISIADVRAARGYINRVSEWLFVTHLEQYWRFFGARVDEVDGVITYVPTGVEYEHLTIATARSHGSDNAMLMAAQEIGDVGCDPDAITLPPIAFRNWSERQTSVACQVSFASRDLSEECLGASLAEWVRALGILNTRGRAAISSRRKARSLDLGSWCLIDTPEGWARLLISGGVSDPSARRIVSALTFTVTSKDLADSPFIRCGDELLGLPGILASIFAPNAIASLFRTHRAILGFKGEGFERELRDCVRQAGVSCDRLFSRGGEDFECDAAFVLDDVLFLVEAKHDWQPTRPRDYADWLLGVGAAAEQLQRTGRFYEKSLAEIRRALCLGDSWIPSEVRRLIVTNVPLGGAMALHGCAIMDAATFGQYWRRAGPAVQIGRVRYQFTGGAFAGRPTASSFAEIVQAPPAIDAMARCFGPLQFEQYAVAGVEVRLWHRPRESPDYRLALDEDEVSRIHQSFGALADQAERE